MERIHIVGVGPRTGTTLLTECMVNCFAIDAFEAHEARLTRHRWGAAVYLTKAPGDIAFCATRLRLDRHCHVLCMIRDPRDTVVSVHGRDPDRYWAPLRYWKTNVVHLRRLAGHPRFAVIRYEDLVSRPDDVQAVIESRLPFLRRTAPFSRFHERATPSAASLAALVSLRPIAPDRIGNWKNHLPRLAGQLRRHGPITRDLIEFGYETDGSWRSALKGIKPDRRRSERPEVAPGSTRLRRAHSRADAIFIAAARLIGLPVV